jgi:putative Mn2+ efflux pump MntP
MLIGKSISHILSIKLANYIGSYILILIGIYGIFKELLYKKDISNSKNKTEFNFSLTKTILLLSINNLATGLSASIAGVNYIFSGLLTFIFSILFLYLGFFIARKIKNNKLDKISNYLSYLIILILGIIELIF